MENETVMVDTSILIDYFRKTDKSKSKLFKIAQETTQLSICSITEFEIYTGSKGLQIEFWNSLLRHFKIFPFDSKAALLAGFILNDLKPKRKSIDKADLFIAAVAMSNNLSFHTLNQKHFNIIQGLKLHA